MSKDRGRRRTVKSTRDRAVPRSRPTVQLAQGAYVDGSAGINGTSGGDGSTAQNRVLVCAEGKVQLNSGAAAILQLCDGSRDRDGIVTELMRDSHRHALAGEIEEFLDAALSRGWIVVA